MRLSIYDLFTVGVVRPKSGWSKGLPFAFIEETDRCVPLVDLVIPNDLDDAALAGYVGNRLTAFARPGKRIVALDAPGPRRSAERIRVAGHWGTARPALQDVRYRGVGPAPHQPGPALFLGILRFACEMRGPPSGPSRSLGM
jgi:hypothetical protein